MLCKVRTEPLWAKDFGVLSFVSLSCVLGIDWQDPGGINIHFHGYNNRGTVTGGDCHNGNNNSSGDRPVAGHGGQDPPSGECQRVSKELLRQVPRNLGSGGPSPNSNPNQETHCQCSAAALWHSFNWLLRRFCISNEARIQFLLWKLIKFQQPALSRPNRNTRKFKYKFNKPAKHCLSGLLSCSAGPLDCRWHFHHFILLLLSLWQGSQKKFKSRDRKSCWAAGGILNTL